MTTGKVPPGPVIRHACALFAASCLLLAAAVYPLLISHEKSRIEIIKARESSHLKNTGSLISSLFFEIISDINVTCALPSLQDYLREPTPATARRLSASLLAVSSEYKRYPNISYIDQNGRETVRIVRDGDLSRPVAPGMLSNDAGMAVFREAVKLPPVRLFISPPVHDAGVSSGSSVRRPVIHFARHLFDDEGNSRGVLLFEYDAGGIESLVEAGSGDSRTVHNGMRTWLVTGVGSGSESGLTPQEEDLGASFPEEWRRIREQGEGSLRTGNGLFLFATVYPLREKRGHQAGGSTYTAMGGGKGAPQAGPADSYYWKAVLLVPEEALRAESILRQSFGRAALAAGLAGLALLCMVIAYSSRYRRVQQLLIEEKNRNLELTNAELQQQREMLQTSQDRFRALVENTSDLIAEIDAGFRFTYLSPKFRDIFGYEPEEFIGRSPMDLVPDEERRQTAEQFMAMVSGMKPIDSIRHRNVCRDGRIITVEVSGIPVFGPAGEFSGYRGITRDITNKLQTELELQENRDMLKGILDTIPQSVFWKDRESRYLGCNRAFADTAGLLSVDTIAGKTDYDLPWTADESGAYRADDRAVMEQNSARYHITEHIRLSDGSVRWLDTTKIPLHDQEGRVYGVLGVFEDITERKTAEELLIRAEQYSRTIIEASPVPVLVVNMDHGHFTFLNRAFVQTFGYTIEELPTVADWWQLAYPDPVYRQQLQERWLQHFEELAVGGRPFVPVEADIRCKDGSVRTVIATAALLGGESEQDFLAILYDITELKRVQEQLQQSQKLESIGQLAGGVAHDFNNKLAVILGNVDLVLMDMNRDDPLRENLNEIRIAAEHSANLTRQLLAFARKQTVTPVMIDLNEAVSSLLKMLRRVIGEDIRLDFRSSSGLWQVRVDPSQVDQILTNLCVNARDAIQGAGSITITTENCVIDDTCCHDCPDAVPGEYVRVTVRDTGCGMDRTTLKYIFEPFYTTKKVGKGTGLGLSTVFGIVRQNEGFVTVESRPGEGTLFSVCFPAVRGGGCPVPSRRQRTVPCAMRPFCWLRMRLQPSK